MKNLKLGRGFKVLALIALLASILLLLIIYQEETIDKACSSIKNNQNEMAQHYIDQIWDIDSCGQEGQTVLMAACQSGNRQMIAYILEKGADPNKTISGRLTPLELFCRDGYKGGKEALLLLLKSGVKQSKYTTKPAVFFLADAFYWMEQEDKAIATEQAILMLQYGAPIGYGKTTLLHSAAKANMGDLFYTLVHSKEGLYAINAVDENGDTPWTLAVKHGSVSVQTVIRNLEKEYEEEQNQNGKDPFDSMLDQNLNGG